MGKFKELARLADENGFNVGDVVIYTGFGPSFFCSVTDYDGISYTLVPLLKQSMLGKVVTRHLDDISLPTDQQIIEELSEQLKQEMVASYDEVI